VNPPSGTEEGEDGGDGRPGAASTFGALRVQSESELALSFHGGGREAIPPPIVAAMAGARPYFTSSA
jgi:hypothetical protein